MLEPIHTLEARTTNDSNAEGRLKLDMASIKKKKKKVLKKYF